MATQVGRIFSKRLQHGSESSDNECHVRQACVLQMDICGFTEFARQLTALDLACVLHELFGAFDTLVQQLQLFKMDTIGDAYIVAGWLPHHDDHDDPEWKKAAQESTAKICTKMLFLAGGMLDILDKFTTRCGKRVSARIGMGRGQVVVGALGSLQPRVHIRGLGMRQAEELEHTGTPATLHICDTVLRPLCARNSADEDKDSELGLPLGWKLSETIQQNKWCSYKLSRDR